MGQGYISIAGNEWERGHGKATTPGQWTEGPPALRGYPEEPDQPNQVPGDREMDSGQCRGVHVMSDLHVEIEAVCELDAHADECCMIILEGASVILLFDMLGEWLV